MARDNLKNAHLAELHQRASELELDGYRMLTRDELIKAIGKEGPKGDAAPASGEAEDAPADVPKPQRRERARREQIPEEDVETEEITGVLDRMPQGYGFLRLSGLTAHEGDVYVSASQIRRCELWPGDEVVGPAREPREGERHRALVRVATVNGNEPEGKRVKFEDLPEADPERELPLGKAGALGPLSFGQRVLVLAEGGAERGALFRDAAAAAAEAGATPWVLLDDETAEDLGEWERAVPDATIVAPPSDMEPTDQIRAAELAVGQAKRRAEGGADVVVIIDSLSRLAEGYRDPNRVRRLFGAGRELADGETGSVTVIAAVVEDDERGEQTREILEGDESVQVRL